MEVRIYRKTSVFLGESRSDAAEGNFLFQRKADKVL
jgi:hypothetical protein